MAQVFLTGGSGFIGGALCERRPLYPGYRGYPEYRA